LLLLLTFFFRNLFYECKCRGEISVNGPPEGKYSLTITPDITVVPALKEVIIQDIIVEIGQTKIIEPINLL
jgi:hypothetical protein